MFSCNESAPLSCWKDVKWKKIAEILIGGTNTNKENKEVSSANKKIFESLEQLL